MCKVPGDITSSITVEDFYCNFITSWINLKIVDAAVIISYFFAILLHNLGKCWLGKSRLMIRLENSSHNNGLHIFYNSGQFSWNVSSIVGQLESTFLVMEMVSWRHNRRDVTFVRSDVAVSLRFCGIRLLWHHSPYLNIWHMVTVVTTRFVGSDITISMSFYGICQLHITALYLSLTSRLAIGVWDHNTYRTLLISTLTCQSIMMYKCSIVACEVAT